VLTTDPDTAGKIRTGIQGTFAIGSQTLRPVFRKGSKKLFFGFFALPNLFNDEDSNLINRKI
jgi:hypothetical protein